MLKSWSSDTFKFKFNVDYRYFVIFPLTQCLSNNYKHVINGMMQYSYLNLSSYEIIVFLTIHVKVAHLAFVKNIEINACPKMWLSFFIEENSRSCKDWEIKSSTFSWALLPKEGFLFFFPRKNIWSTFEL